MLSAENISKWCAFRTNYHGSHTYTVGMQHVSFCAVGKIISDEHDGATYTVLGAVLGDLLSMMAALRLNSQEIPRLRSIVLHRTLG